MQQECDHQRCGNKGQAPEVALAFVHWAAALTWLRYPSGLPQHVHARAAGFADQLLGRRPVEQLPPPGMRWLHDDDVRHVAGACVLGDRFRDVLTRQCDRLRAETLCQPHRFGDPIAFRVPQIEVAARLDVHRGPRRFEAVGHALCVTHHIRPAGVAADAGEDPLAGRPGSRDGMRLHIAHHLLIHPLRGTAQCQLAQCGKVAGLEVVTDGAFCLVRHVHLAVAQTL